MDLSYRHGTNAEALATEILAAQGPPVVQVDMSSSALGDDGVQRILQAVLTSSSDDDDDSSPVSFIAQNNGVTPKGATQLIEAILSSSPTTTTLPQRRRRQVASLDLSWSHLHSEAAGLKSFHTALENLLGNVTHCPTDLRLDRCGLTAAACRAIGKGLIHRFTHHHHDTTTSSSSTVDAQPASSLSLCGNTAIGDAGTAAIAAAMRFVASTPKKADNHEDQALFERLDLSACDIGDTGAEALALALESSLSCCLVRHLDLSNNRITERGVQALSQALVAAASNRPHQEKQQQQQPLVLCLDLSNNNIGDGGASSIATCLIENNLVPSIILRSCHIHADGAEALGKSLRVYAANNRSRSLLSLDLSGNPFGVLRGKSTTNGGKYSASRLKSKASATAVSYMNQGISFLRKGLKDVRVDMGSSSTAESDDEEENRSDTLRGDEMDASRARCGGRALSLGFTEPDDNSENHQSSHRREEPGKIYLGLRHCFFDHAAADSLAEMKVVAKDEFGIDLQMDVRLNPVLEDGMVSALHGQDDDLLHEMAEAHNDKMQVIRDTQGRAKEAARARAESSAFEDTSWDAPVGLDDDLPDDELLDSDADYENEEEYD